MISKVFFWQNINSIHQSAFFNALALKKEIEVFLICSEKLSNERLDMGWESPYLNTSIKFIESQDFTFLKSIIQNNCGVECCHIFSGIAAFNYVHQVFKYAIKNKCRVAVLSEPLDFRGIKGFMRLLRGVYHRFLYKSHIEFILSIGERAAQQFFLWGYERKKVFLWGYCVENSSNNLQPKQIDNYQPFKILYSGSLYSWKGFDILLDALDELNKERMVEFVADFFCYNPTKSKGKVLKIIQQNIIKSYINLNSFISNRNLRMKMAEYDLLVLPSRYDGWGAVVSEALMEGLPVLVSSNCGVECLFNSDLVHLGRKVTPFSMDKLKIAIKHKILEGKITNIQKNKVKEWAEKSISGDSFASYFKEILTYADSINKIDKQFPKAPWLY